MASLSLRGLTSLEGIAGSLLPRLPEIKIRLQIPSIFIPNNNNNTTTTNEQQVSLRDNGILKAAPKQKVSHLKRRQKLYAPGKKQVKLQNNLNRCPSCGHYKRSHFLCMNCVSQIKKLWKDQDAEFKPEPYREEFKNPLDEKVLYPGKTERYHDRMLRKKEYLVQRPKTLPVEPKK
ncbi:unnamed protein product [[Candida] boidinii]|nr:unnamed protein product [[Candida] boidinii]